MKTIRSDILAALSGSAAVRAIVGPSAGIYPVLAPLGADRPFVIYKLSGVEPSQTHDMRQGEKRPKASGYLWEITAHAEDIDVASDLAEAVFDALNAKTTAAGSAVFLFQGAEDEADYKQDSSNEIVFRVVSTFLCRRRPA